MKTYEFYTIDKHGNERFFCTKDCKAPRRTKAYKELVEIFDNSVIRAFGYRLIY